MAIGAKKLLIDNQPLSFKIEGVEYMPNVKIKEPQLDAEGQVVGFVIKEVKAGNIKVTGNANSQLAEDTMRELENASMVMELDDGRTLKGQKMTATEQNSTNLSDGTLEFLFEGNVKTPS